MSIRIRDKGNDEPEQIYIPPMEEETSFEDMLTPEQKELQDLHDMIEEVDPTGAPLVSVLEAWKFRHKTIFVSKVSSESKQYFIFTTIKRAEFKSLQETGVFENEEKGNEILVEKCLLYPLPDARFRLTSDAGVITTLGKQIAYKSGFVSPQEALSLIKII